MFVISRIWDRGDELLSSDEGLVSLAHVGHWILPATAVLVMTAGFPPTYIRDQKHLRPQLSP